MASKVGRLRAWIGRGAGRFAPMTYASSLGPESMVLTEIICAHFPDIEIFTLDTGRLPEPTLELLERLQRRHPGRIRVYYPDPQTLETYVSGHGINGFFHSLDVRRGCCQVRKVEPFRRALAGKRAWITGVRREQSTVRAAIEAVEWDARFGLYKLSPLLDWSEDDVWRYIKEQDLPYNRLHDRGYPSVGCEPCTRAVLAGEDPRAGRWWWERTETRECGLQPGSCAA